MMNRSTTPTDARWYATRTVPMPDEDERNIREVMLWVERRDGGIWAVGRASDLAQREYDQPRESDYIFVGFALEDALRAANEALEDDVSASEMDGIDPRVPPITRSELEQPLQEWFWGRRAV